MAFSGISGGTQIFPCQLVGQTNTLNCTWLATYQSVQYKQNDSNLKIWLLHSIILFQFYRTFVISVLTTFIINPVYRQAAFLLTLVLFVVHDRYRKPYKNSFLNTVQLFSSLCLLLVLGCNSLAAYSKMVTVTQIPLVFTAKEILHKVEMIVYACVPLTFPLWKIIIMVTARRAGRGRGKKETHK